MTNKIKKNQKNNNKIIFIYNIIFYINNKNKKILRKQKPKEIGNITFQPNIIN